MSLKEDLLVSGLFKLENKFLFNQANTKVKLSINKESRKIKNIFTCLKKTILNRYIK